MYNYTVSFFIPNEVYNYLFLSVSTIFTPAASPGQTVVVPITIVYWSLPEVLGPFVPLTSNVAVQVPVVALTPSVNAGQHIL